MGLGLWRWLGPNALSFSAVSEYPPFAAWHCQQLGSKRRCSRLSAPRLRTGPYVLDRRRMQESLHDHAILLSFLLERGQLLCRRLRRTNIEIDPDILKSDGRR